jgi:hypothetical protein
LNCGHEVSFSASAYSVRFYSTAADSIITSLSFGRRATSTAVRVGRKASKILPYTSQLTDPWLAVEFGDVTSQENQIAASQERYKSCYRRREFWKCDVENL